MSTRVHAQSRQTSDTSVDHFQSLSLSVYLTADGHTVGSGFVLTAGKRDTPPFLTTFTFRRRIFRPLRAVSAHNLGGSRVNLPLSRSLFSQISAELRFQAVMPNFPVVLFHHLHSTLSRRMLYINTLCTASTGPRHIGHWFRLSFPVHVLQMQRWPQGSST